MENLPPMICDLCIVQLNVAYNFKRQASESDTKLRQYLIENGIDIIKDTLSLPASSVAAAIPPPIITSPPPIVAPTPTSIVGSSSILRPAAIAAAPSRRIPGGIQRSNSTASSAVLEIPAAVRNQRQQEHQLVVPHQLRPIRVKVETPETGTERSSEGGDLLCNSDISPLSSVTSNAVPIPVQNGKTPVVTVDSSPGSSKGSTSERSNGAMVVVSSDNVSMQGDEDFVQNILGSNSSIATSSKTTEGDKQESSEIAATPEKIKDSTTEQHQGIKKRDRLQALLAKLSIDMVNSAKYPKSKQRTKPKKSSEANSAIKKRKRNTLDYAQLFSKRTKPIQDSPTADDRRRNPVARRSANVISANKLRTLGEKIRAEKELSASPGRKMNTDEPKRRRVLADSSTAEVNGPLATRASLP